MKASRLGVGLGLAIISAGFAVACGVAERDPSRSEGGAAGSATGGSNAAGADASGGNASGGNASGGNASGGNASGGNASGGSSIATGGNSLGGAPANGGMSLGGAGTGTGGIICCAATPSCQPGEQQIRSTAARRESWLEREDCPADAGCYKSEICCSSVWCARALSECTARPVCRSGDLELSGPCPGSECYSRSVCGFTIHCLPSSRAGGAPSEEECDPALEPDRNYVAKTPATCAVIDFACPAYTTYFANDCGCGCEQGASCPDSVNCIPGPQGQDALCLAIGFERCPYTLRIY
jgi:hypothetical protein